MTKVTEKIPQICLNELNNLRNFVNDIISKYKSLSNWGKPIFTNEMQVACIIWLNDRMNIGLQQIANMIGIDKTTLYKLYKRIEETSKFNIYDVNTKTIVTVQRSKLDLLNMVDEALQPKAKVVISDLMESSIVRNFLTATIQKRTKVKGHKPILTDRAKTETLRVIKLLIEYFSKVGKPTNPDVWSEQDVKLALFEIYNNDYSKVRRAMKALRRVPEWSNWFKGEIGAEVAYVKPVMRFLTYEQYLQIKRFWKMGMLNDAEFIIPWLHLTCGCREGWTVEGVNESTSLEECQSSLVGLRWEKLQYVAGTWVLEIYESKTGRWWYCDITWLDSEPAEVLLRYRRDRGSIVATITGCRKVGEFAKWYREVLRKISELLGLPFRLVPHDLRRSHISILAELGVPLEIAVSGHMDFGVGWEDLKTAVVFYLRFSRYVKQKVMEQINERKKEIESMFSA
jgi:Phage integrase family.